MPNLFLEYYKWKGLLAHKYDNFQFPYDAYNNPLAMIYSINPNYPSNPSSYLCKSTLFELTGNRFENYALKAIGYISVPKTSQYQFKIQCDALCQLNMTRSGSETVLGDYNIAADYQR